MVRKATTTVLGILAGLAAPALVAQSPWLPASDPVGIGRAGVGVAFGQSLEAAALNPALLATLRTGGEAYLAAGMEMACSQETLAANSRVLKTSDRNRFLPSAGGGFQISDRFSLGFKLDMPFSRHGVLPDESGSRFLGQSIDLGSHRAELQAAWALTPQLAVGIGAGVTRVSYASEVKVRTALATDPTLPVGAGNPSEALLEAGMHQEGDKVLPSFSAGFRYALAPRWTLAGAYQSGVSGTLDLKARMLPGYSLYDRQNGLGSAPLGLDDEAAALMGLASARSGRGKLTMPARATLGVRQRFNQFFTWEADLHYVGASSLALPTQPSLVVPGAVVAAPVRRQESKSGLGYAAAGEFTFAKRWTLRMGFSMEPAYRTEAEVDPLTLGAATSTFAGGVGYRVWGGELNLGYQVRLGRDALVTASDGAWGGSGYQPSGALVRVGGQGHLWSLGFRKAF